LSVGCRCIVANFGRFVLIFNKIVLIILAAFLIFIVLSFEFHRVKLPWLHRQWWVASNSSDLNLLDYQVWGQCRSLITSSNQTPKTFPEFKDELQSIRSAVSEKAIDNAVIDYRKQLRACVSVNSRYFKHIMHPKFRHNRDADSYI